MTPLQRPKDAIVMQHGDRANRVVVVDRAAPRASVFRRVFNSAVRYLNGADLDGAEVPGHRSTLRLPAPMPTAVRGVAIGQLITGLGGLFASCVLLPARNILVAVHWPNAPWFSLAVSAVIGAAMGAWLPWLLTRGALRLLRRDPRGIRTVHHIAVFTAWASEFGAAYLLYGWAFGTAAMHLKGLPTGAFALTRALIGLATAILFQLWTIRALRRYRDELEAEKFPLP